jgi:hypothetical protein
VGDKVSSSGAKESDIVVFGTVYSVIAGGKESIVVGENGF